LTIDDTARIWLAKTADAHRSLGSGATPFARRNWGGGDGERDRTLNAGRCATPAGTCGSLRESSAVAREAHGDRMLSEDDLLKPATHYGVLQSNRHARVFHATNGITSVGRP
jgi:hypothetical protein